MKKLISVALSIGLLAGAYALPAEAGKRKKKKPVKITREAQGTYAAPATVIGNCTQTDGIGCMTIPSGSNEEYITAKVTDQTGLPVLVSVDADLDGDATSETHYGSFCGETTEPIKIDPGVQLIFWVSAVTDAPNRTGCAPGQGTTGTLDVVFSNLP